MKVFKVLLLGIILAQVLNAYSSSEDDPIQRQALIALYDNTGGNQWKKRSYWKNSSVSYCHWYGVKCKTITIPNTSPQVNRNIVTELLLRENNLKGSIPEELSTLSGLEVIQFGGNNLAGSIPKEICSLANLEKLDLDRNNLEGTIPNEIVNLENLEIIYLNENKFTGTILDKIVNLTNLKKIWIRKNHFTGSIPREIKNLENLITLGISYNHFIGIIPKEIIDLENLGINELGLNNNCSLKAENDDVIEFINSKQPLYQNPKYYKYVLHTNGKCMTNMSPIYYLLMN